MDSKKAVCTWDMCVEGQVYSIRMRSAQGGSHESGGLHVSGAERIVTVEALQAYAAEMIERALTHPKGPADFINITIDAIPPEAVRCEEPLEVKRHERSTIERARQLGMELLREGGISLEAIQKGFQCIDEQVEPLSGAIVLDEAGHLLLPEYPRGVRVTRMDLHEDSSLWDRHGDGLSDNVHFREALVLATKLAHGPGVLGELCWSDDPAYTTGYVVANGVYHRLSPMKDVGIPRGGRVFFVKAGTDMDAFMRYIREVPVLVK